MMSGAFDLNPYDYDAGFVGGPPPTYELAAPPPPDPFVAGDGVVDTGATAIPGGGPSTMSIQAAVSGNWLYLATQNTGAGSDHFVFLSKDAPGALAAAPWSKAGMVALPSTAFFAARENDGPFAGWFKADGTLLEAAGTESRADLSCGASGSFFEATIDLGAAFGSVPDTIYLAVAPFASADGGALYSSAQMPATVNGDGNIDSSEFATVSVASIRIK
jgi:hypothetical protein